jgi:D-alanyl-D-alanine carboxypeptidase (penicillin-binding protein 5/6)
MRYDQTLAATFSGTRFGQVPMANQNALLTQYPGGIGGKIGWTMAAGATYLGMARRHGVTLIVTILHATPLTEIATAERLLNWGFAVNGHLRAVGTLVPPLAGP